MADTHLLSLTLNDEGKTQAKINVHILDKLSEQDTQYILAQVHIVNELLVEAFKR